MSITEAIRPSIAYPPRAWPVVGGGVPRLGSPMEAEKDIGALQSIGAKMRVSRNETIFNEGDQAQYCYKVVSGVVRLCKHMADGRRQIVQFQFPGDFFSFAEFKEHSFTAEAVTDLVLVSYPQRQVAKLSEQRPGLRERFLKLLAQNVCAMQGHIMLLGRQTAKERVISFLMFLAKRVGSEEDDLVDVPMSRLDIADYLGLRVETVCRALSDLERARIIDLSNSHQITLLNIDKLEALADGEE